jgi:hypothetical protein
MMNPARDNIYWAVVDSRNHVIMVLYKANTEKPRKHYASKLLLQSRSMCDNRRGLDWIFDLLTTYTHDS